ncbi:MAG: hypothetical protein ACPGVD_04045 [Flavobacteriales bacterium]
MLSGNSQLIVNSHGEVVFKKYFFNPSNLKKNKIKSITTSYFKKEPLQSLIPLNSTSEYYVLDTNGLLSHKYYIKKTNFGNTDSMVEINTYQQNLLTEIKKVKGNKVEIESFVYNKSKPTVIVYSSAINISSNIAYPKLKTYQDEKVEYLEYSSIGKSDTLVRYKNINQMVYKKVLFERLDSHSLKETHTYIFKPNQNKTITYYYFNNQLKKIKIEGVSIQNNHYVFEYDSKKLLSYTKFDTQWNKQINKTQLVYDEKNGNLQAIITKNKSNSISIKKFKYIYYE